MYAAIAPPRCAKYATFAPSPVPAMPEHEVEHEQADDERPHTHRNDEQEIHFFVGPLHRVRGHDAEHAGRRANDAAGANEQHLERDAAESAQEVEPQELPVAPRVLETRTEQVQRVHVRQQCATARRARTCR